LREFVGIKKSAHSIALGFAIGTFIGIMPTPGFGVLFALLVVLFYKEVNKIFDHFVQAKQMIGPGEHGTGLGLSIAKQLVEIHGGKIEVETREDCGTAITIFLPLSFERVPEPAIST